MLTLDALCTQMRDSGRNLTPRQARDWWTKGLLPKPRRRGLGRGLGTESFWVDRRVLRQAQAAYDVLAQHARSDPTLLALWLLGFPVPLTAIRRVYDTWITKGLQAVRHVGEPPEDILGGMAHQAALLQAKRASLPAAIRDNFADLALEVLGVFYGFNDEPDFEGLGELWAKVAPYLNSGINREGGSLRSSQAAEILEIAIKFIKDAASLPVQQRVMTAVGDHELIQARRLILVTSGHLRRTMPANQKGHDSLFYRLVIVLGQMAIPILVSILRDGATRHKIVQALLGGARKLRCSQYKLT